MSDLPAVTTVGGHLPTHPGATDRDPAQNPYYAYLGSLESAESRRTMQGCLNRIARIITGIPDDEWDRLPADVREHYGAAFPWERLRYEHTIHVRTQLINLGWSPSHTNKHLVALRRVLKEAWRLGLISAEDFHRATDLRPVKGTRLPAGAYIPEEIITAVLRSCDEDIATEDRRNIGLRDGALIATLWSTGLRRAEAAELTIDAYDPRDASMRVVGKGNKERRVYLIPDAVERLERWLAVRGRKPGALFPALRKQGQIVYDAHGRPKPMTGRGLSNVVAVRFDRAGVASRTPHDFRRTFISRLLDGGTDLSTAQMLAGHASPVTTAGYDRRPEEARRDAVLRSITLP
ncbi:tyrosine-type recombinase/integrase [Thermobispora bispora]|uniref:tyrosine-type recombinase/integrase n=1 Tax=Thermobispora bispora TaxID=2006 RepID=UPI00197E3CF5|nr:tyrosine-type recombinase/integrase [Thermobispora bispora]QSI49919.1 integrase [Thermobispora bispora]